ncbi:mRNA splicing protein SMX2 KNAG_0E03380 [Huiozyma naganishii CBS 8797]|uniref:Small nuclear ribonucleoprotein G n=1 Tax=Huiozyma naganishii (strain ATCC MYA-139 / BCRC 22969 / CBS 8797 / KCTC 17520 / NBRC 10181 / NCYC 3082 / Yp74L-3) TaxID=1071383 RepID=J7S7Z6_HUIN7|nr:hypothetical protein KNAG_0E03380 [Kazachstania naganishii CBS 8797]CCK70596.1 hypothetical protein KNAG_0E03380 [Kazachstania naganishii CBS 8797]
MVSTPELKRYMDKKVVLQINGSRKVAGTMRGFDLFLNVVLDDAVELLQEEGKTSPLGSPTVIRGNSIVSIESLETVV